MSYVLNAHFPQFYLLLVELVQPVGTLLLIFWYILHREAPGWVRKYNYMALNTHLFSVSFTILLFAVRDEHITNNWENTKNNTPDAGRLWLGAAWLSNDCNPVRTQIHIPTTKQKRTPIKKNLICYFMHLWSKETKQKWKIWMTWRIQRQDFNYAQRAQGESPFVKPSDEV